MDRLTDISPMIDGFVKYYSIYERFPDTPKGQAMADHYLMLTDEDYELDRIVLSDETRRAMANKNYNDCVAGIAQCWRDSLELTEEWMGVVAKLDG